MSRWNILKRLYFIVLLFVVPSSYVCAQHKGINFQAVFKKPDGTFPTVSGVTATVQFLDPVSRCVLREEEHHGKNLSNGYLHLVIGDASALLPNGKKPSPVLSLAESMNNRVVRTGLTCVDVHNNIIATNQTYSPTNLDHRILRVRVNIQGEDVAADFNMRAVGFAVNTEMLNSKTDSDFINIKSSKGVTQDHIESIFEQFTKLNAILGKTNSSGNSLDVNITGNAATATTATTLTGGVNVLLPAQASQGGKYLSTNGTDSSWSTVASSAGTITELNPGTGLTGGGDTGAVTINLNNLATEGTYTKVITDAQGRVVNGSTLGASDIPSLDASKITTGTFSGTRVTGLGIEKLINSSGKYFNYKPNNVACAGGETLKYDSALNSGSGGWKCATDHVGILPSDSDYAAKGLVKFNTDPATSGVNITSGVATVNAGTTANSIVKLDALGKLPAIDGSQLINLLAPSSFTGSLAGDVTGTQGATVVGKIKGQTVTATATLAGQVLKYAGSNNWIPGFVTMEDLRTSATGTNSFAGSCGANQTLTFNSVGDVMSCQSISITKSQVSDFPTLSVVATSGSYNDLSGKPTIPATQVNSDWNAVSGTAQILNKPTLGTLAAKNIVTTADLAIGAVTSVKIVDNSVTDAKIQGMDSIKLTGTIAVDLLPVAGVDEEGIVNQLAQSFSGAKTFLNSLITEGTVSVADLVTANGGVSTTTLSASSLGQFDRLKLANSSSSCDVSIEGSLRYNTTKKKMEFCNGNSWIVLNVGDPCFVGSPSPGTVCHSGAIFLGVLSPGSTTGTGTNKYMTTPGGCGEIPAGQIGGGTGPAAWPSTDFTPTCSGTDSLTKYWNDGTSNYYDFPNLTNYTATDGTGYGATNTDNKYGSQNAVEIVANTEAGQGGYHAAARYCDKLVYGGYNDWYLPNRYELNLFYTHKASIPGLDLTDQNWYWSSTEGSIGVTSWRQRFSDGYQIPSVKIVDLRVRCVRRF